MILPFDLKGGVFNFSRKFFEYSWEEKTLQFIQQEEFLVAINIQGLIVLFLNSSNRSGAIVQPIVLGDISWLEELIKNC